MCQPQNFDFWALKSQAPELAEPAVVTPLPVPKYKTDD